MGFWITLGIVLAAPAWAGPPDAAQAWHEARQMVLVVTPGWTADHGTLQGFERTPDGWQKVAAAVPVMVGKQGAAWGLGLHPAMPDGPHKREGDGRSPAGVFALGTAFGYAAHAATALPWRALKASDWCVDVPAAADYNRIVDAAVAGAAAVAGSTEPMRRDLRADGDQRYALGFVIQHNATARPGAGSCIFAHLWLDPDTPTTGCTAMAPASMRSLLYWLRPAAHPVFVLLPQAEYERLRAAWQLPRQALDAGA